MTEMEASAPSFEWLPVEVVGHIFHFLEASSFPFIACVCRLWREVSLDCVRSRELPQSEDLCAELALQGRLSMLQWLRARGCPWNWKTYAYAAKGGHREVLEWLRASGCPIDEDTYAFAEAEGLTEVLKCLKENKCPTYRGVVSDPQSYWANRFEHTSCAKNAVLTHSGELLHTNPGTLFNPLTLPLLIAKQQCSASNKPKRSLCYLYFRIPLPPPRMDFSLVASSTM